MWNALKHYCALGQIDLPSVLAAKLIYTDTTFFVRADGSDGNSGTVDSAGGAWLTLQHALNYISANCYILPGVNCIVQVRNGTFVGVDTTGKPLRGPGGNIVFIGNNASPSLCVIQPGVNCFNLVGLIEPDFYISGFTLDPNNTGWDAIYSGFGPGTLQLGAPSIVSATGINIYKGGIQGNCWDSSTAGNTIDGNALVTNCTASGNHEFWRMASPAYTPVNTSFPFLNGPNYTITGTVTTALNQWVRLFNPGVRGLVFGPWVGASNVNAGVNGAQVQLGAMLYLASGTASLPGGPPICYGDGFILDNTNFLAPSSVRQLGYGSHRVSRTTSFTLGGNESHSNDAGYHFDNTGASAEVDLTLPVLGSTYIGMRYGFTVIAAQTLKIIGQSTMRIANGASQSALGGNIASNTPFSHVELEMVSSTQWVVVHSTGTWTVT